MVACLSFVCARGESRQLPAPLVRLRDVDSTILQDLRYASSFNFTGRIVPGYQNGECILLKGAAEALSKAQAELRAQNLGLKVFDCLRPIKAVNAFVKWSAQPVDPMLTIYHPRILKSRLFAEGYIARHSSHSRGAAVDITLIAADNPPAATGSEILGPCNGPASARVFDNGLDMGTSFDCFDPMSHTRAGGLSAQQRANRAILVKAMQTHGFRNYAREWWHFEFTGTSSHRVYDIPLSDSVPAR
jgi:zinc D-Ala-D-Ala dipeptidase